MAEQPHGKIGFGAFFQKLRKERRITLRAFYKKAEADPGNISKMERGLLPPPQDEEILGKYAKALDIQEGSEEWYRFIDLAAIDRGIMPADIMLDKELVKMLPILFKTLRGQKPSEKELVRLADKIRKS